MFWAGDFGNEYTDRNKGVHHQTSNIFFWSKIIEKTGPIHSCLEIGCNRGMNLNAIKILQPECMTSGIEINSSAAELAARSGHNVVIGSAVDEALEETVELPKVNLTISCGVLIHINPCKLPEAYSFLFSHSKEYILISEYFSPRPEEVLYRGHSNKLFKRDFAGEFIDRYTHNIRVVDYGFCWNRDPVAPRDNLTWFLFQKVS